MKRTLAIIGNEHQTLPVLRYFARAGFEVHVFSNQDELQRKEVLSSRYIKREHIHMFTCVNQLLTDVECLKQRSEDFSIIITSASELTRLRFEAKSLWSDCKMIVPPPETINLLATKDKMYALCHEKRLATLRYAMVNDYREGDLSFPVVLKRNIELLSLFQYKCIFFRSHKELVQFIETIKESDRKDLILQECVPDDFIDVDMRGYVHKGTILGSAVVKEIRSYPDGVPSYLEEISDHHAKRIENVVAAIVREIDYTGFISVDLKYRESDGTAYILDVNPRTPASVDSWFKKYKKKGLVNFFMNIDNPPKLTPKANSIKWINWHRDIMARVKAREFSNLGQFFSSKIDFWDIADPIPFFAVWYYIFKRKLSK